MLHSLGCLQYSPSLEHHIRQLQPIESGHSWEVQLRGKPEIGLPSNSSTFHLLLAASFLLIPVYHNIILPGPRLSTLSPPLDLPIPPSLTLFSPSTGCSIWCVELLRREILRQHPESTLNAILIDFFLYDTIKDKQEQISADKKREQNDLIPHHRTRSIWY